jgi:hypothetical protein
MVALPSHFEDMEVLPPTLTGTIVGIYAASQPINRG